MISYYGYTDGSGEYYIIIDSDKCNGCQKCINQCPQNILQIDLLFIDLEDKPIATVKENQCNKIKYTCTQQCNPEKKSPPCATICPTKAITYHFNTTINTNTNTT